MADVVRTRSYRVNLEQYQDVGRRGFDRLSRDHHVEMKR
jgi:hypothetical protein